MWVTKSKMQLHRVYMLLVFCLKLAVKSRTRRHTLVGISMITKG